MTKNTPNEAPESADVVADPTAGKGRPTPTRKEREAMNKRPLVPGDRKEAQKAARVKLAEQREKARVGLAAGDERFLPVRDRGAQKRWVRDYVDARFSVGEFLIPVMFVVIIVTFLPDASVALYGMLMLWVFFAVAVLDCVFLGLRIRRKLTAKFGTAERGVRWYASMRALQLRVLRLPKPQVKRRAFPS